MSEQLKHDNHYREETLSSHLTDKKVNLTDLMAKLKEEKKKDRANNIIISAAAISAVTVFGIILTL